METILAAILITIFLTGILLLFVWLGAELLEVSMTESFINTLMIVVTASIVYVLLLGFDWSITVLS